MKPHEYVILEVARERERQVSYEGWTPEHDDAEHCSGELAMAAASYAAPRTIYTKHDRCNEVAFHEQYPFGIPARLTKHDRRRQLIIAAALIVAEIERLDRATK